MSERIEWSDTETRNYRCWLRVVRCWEVTPGRIEGQVEGQATVEDLRRACEAAGLTLATAQHAEDLEKLGREMSELVAQRDGALGNIRDLRNRHVEAYAVLGAAIGEHLDAAARRVVAERDAMAAELSAGCVMADVMVKVVPDVFTEVACSLCGCKRLACSFGAPTVCSGVDCPDPTHDVMREQSFLDVVAEQNEAARAEGRAAERSDMLAFVAEACRLGTQGDALLKALMAKGKHEGAAALGHAAGYAEAVADVVAWLRARAGGLRSHTYGQDDERAVLERVMDGIEDACHVGAAKKGGTP